MRFGYVLKPEQARPYLRLCHMQPGAVGQLGVQAQGKQVLFLRDTDWMAILDSGRVVDLVLCKGY